MRNDSRAAAREVQPAVQMQVPSVKAPMSIIALFVFLIEAAFAFPVTQVDGAGQLIFIVFMTVFPFFVGACFFFILWHRPLNLYNPSEVPEELRRNAFEYGKRAVALEEENTLLREAIKRLQAQAGPNAGAVLLPEDATRLAEAAAPTQPVIEAVAEQVAPKVPPPAGDLESAVKKVQQQVQQTRQELERRTNDHVRGVMLSFGQWLSNRGFDDLPDPPEIVLEPESVMNAYYVPSSNSAHFGLLISEDDDTIAHTYFHVVTDRLGVLSTFEGETAALLEGYCDYYACSYNGDPLLGEKFAEALGLEQNALRDLTEIVRLDDERTDPYTQGLVWSGAGWELREPLGDEIVDRALQRTLVQLGTESTIRKAAGTLTRELVAESGKESRAAIVEVFAKRAVTVAAGRGRAATASDGSRSG